MSENRSDPIWFVALFLLSATLGMVACAVIDIALNYSIMSSAMADPVTGKSEASIALVLGSAVMLIAYWCLGVLYAKSFFLRKFAVGGYFAIVSVLTALLYPVQGPRFNEMWSSVSNGGLGDDMPFALLVFLVFVTAILYSGPGLAFVWCKGRFVYWMERCSAISRARKDRVIRNQVRDLDAVLDHFSDESQQAQAVRRALRAGLESYTASLRNNPDAAQCLQSATNLAKGQS